MRNVKEATVRSSESGKRFWRWVPGASWLRTYRGAALRSDLVAGLTLAAYLLPAAIGDASLARLPPEAGLYACLFSGLVFWLFCSSRHTSVTVTSAISLLIGSSLGNMANGDLLRFGALASGTALLVAAIAFAAWLFKAGAIVRFISEGVMVGFKCGVALYLSSTQLTKLCGIPHAAHGDFWSNTAAFARHLTETNLPSLAVGGTALALLVAGKVFLRNKPVALLVVAAAIGVSTLAGLERYGVSALGVMPHGIPALHMPAIHIADLNKLLPLAFACFLLGVVETAAIGRMFAAKYGRHLDADREILALAAANLAAGFGQGYPVSGGLSQSVVNESGGAKTPFSGVVASLCILVAVLAFSQRLHALPQPVLAAVVLVAVADLFRLSHLRHLWQGDRQEFVAALATLFGVLGSGLLRGVLIGAVISLVQLIRRASRPHVAVLGRIPGTRRYSDRDRHPDNETVPNVLIFRPESALVYFNVDHVRDEILRRLAVEAVLPKLVVLDLSASSYVDMQSARTLAGLAGELEAQGMRLQVVEALAIVRDRFRSEGVDARLGGVTRFVSVADAVELFAGASGAG